MKINYNIITMENYLDIPIDNIIPDMKTWIGSKTKLWLINHNYKTMREFAKDIRCESDILRKKLELKTLYNIEKSVMFNYIFSNWKNINNKLFADCLNNKYRRSDFISKVESLYKSIIKTQNIFFEGHLFSCELDLRLNDFYIKITLDDNLSIAKMFECAVCNSLTKLPILCIIRSTNLSLISGKIYIFNENVDENVLFSEYQMILSKHNNFKYGTLIFEINNGILKIENDNMYNIGNLLPTIINNLFII